MKTTLTANWTYISIDQYIKFTNSTTGGTGSNIYSYTVYPVSGSCAGEVNQYGNEMQFINAGTCNVVLKVTDKTGEVNQSNVTITVTPRLEITSFSANWTTISDDQSVQFTNSTTGGTGTNVFAYSLNNTAGVTQTGNKFAFGTAGKYLVTLKVTDLTGETDQSTATITVTPPLKTTLTANWTTISAGQWVRFTNTTTGGTGSNVYWYSNSCGDAAAADGNIRYFPNADPTCNVTLHVSDFSGETNSSSVTIDVTPPLVTTLMNESRLYISAGQSVKFTNSTTGGTGSIVNHYFVNGVLVTPLVNGSIVFPTQGTYSVTLGTTDATGEVSNSSAIVVTVTPPLVTTLLNESRTYISTEQSVSFTNLTTGGTGTIVNHYFVNGALVTPLVNGSIVFTTAGTYSVTLGTTDASGEVSNSSAIVVTVTPPLEITLTANRTLISVGQQIKFTNGTTGGTGSNVYSYTTSCGGTVKNVSNGNIWQFNTQTSEDGCSVTLHISDASGEVNQSVVSDIVVKPVLKFTSFTGTTPISLDQATTFTNATAGGTGLNVFTYSLVSGPEGGLLVNQGSNMFSFTESGTYTVKLGVSDTSGETNSTTIVIQVNPALSVAPLPVVSIDQNQVFTFNAVASGGTLPYGYKWTVSSKLTVLSGCTTTFQCTVAGNAIGNGFTVNVLVTDASAGTPAETAASNTVVSVNVGLTEKPVTSSHSNVDQGQLSVETATVVGGTPPFGFQWFEQPGNTQTWDLIPGAVSYQYIFVTTPSTVIGNWEFNSLITDNGIPPEMVNESNQEGVSVYPQLLATATANPTQMAPGGISILTGSATGGTNPANYECRWFEQLPGNPTFSTVPFGGSNCNTYTFVTTAGTQQGTWIFKMQVTDTGTTVPYITNSTLASVTVGQFGAALVPSTTVLDSGQSDILVATATGGTQPYTYVWTGPGTSSCNIVTSNTVVACVVSPTTAFPTEITYSVTITDATSTSQSGSTNLVVNPTPTATFTPAETVLDSGEVESYLIGVNGGTGPFHITLYNVTGHVLTGYSTTILSPGESGGIGFIVGATGQFTYNAVITDQGTGVAYVFNTISNTIVVNAALGSLLTVVPKSVDVGSALPSTLTASISGGTAPYTFNFIVINGGNMVFDQLNGPTSIKGSAAQFTAHTNATGTDTVDVVVRDATSNPTGSCTPINGCETLTNTTSVYTMPTVTAAPTSQAEEAGNTITLTATVGNAGSGIVSYQWYNGTLSSPVSGETNPTYTATAGALGTYNYFVVVTDSDGGTGQSNTGSVMVTAAPTPTAITVTPSSATIDTGFSTTLSATASGGSGTGYVYTWYTGSVCSGTPLSTLVSPTATTSYCVSVTDSLSDPAGTGVETVTVNPQITITGATAPVSAYTGAPVDLSATSASGGTGVYTTEQWFVSTTDTNSSGSPVGTGGSLSTIDTESIPGTYYYYLVVSDGYLTATTPTFAVNLNSTPTSGSILVVADTNGNDGTFNFTYVDTSNALVNGTFSITTEGNTGSYEITGLNTSTYYNITEKAPYGWVEGGAPGCSNGNLADYAKPNNISAITCVFFDVQNATLVVVKNALGGDGTFNFTLDGNPFNITTTSGTGSKSYTENVTSLYHWDSSFITYTLREIVPGGWNLTNATCSGSNDRWYTNNNDELDFEPGQTVTCTFTDVAAGYTAPNETTNSTTTVQVSGSTGVGGGGGGSPCLRFSHQRAEDLYAARYPTSRSTTTRPISVLNTTFKVTENYITPTTAGITIGNNTYELSPDVTESIGTLNGINYTIELTSLSYLPILDTVSVAICGTVPVALPALVVPANQTLVVTNVTTSGQSISGAYNASNYQWYLFKVNGLGVKVEVESNSSARVPENISITKYTGPVSISGDSSGSTEHNGNTSGEHNSGRDGSVHMQLGHSVHTAVRAEERSLDSDKGLRG